MYVALNTMYLDSAWNL